MSELFNKISDVMDRVSSYLDRDDLFIQANNEFVPPISRTEDKRIKVCREHVIPEDRHKIDADGYLLLKADVPEDL